MTKEDPVLPEAYKNEISNCKGCLQILKHSRAGQIDQF